MSLRLATAAAVLALIATPAFAQDTSSAAGPPPGDPIETGGDSLTIGVGIASVPSYEGSDSNRVIPGGAVRGTYKGISFQTRGTKLFVDVIPSDSGPGYDFQLGPVVGVNLNRTSRKSIDDIAVERLGTVDTAIEVGGFVGIGKTGVITSDYDKLSVSVSYYHDVANAYDSYVITPQIDYGTPLSRKIFVGISANAAYAGGGYADTYFSVTPAGRARSGFAVYDADKGWKSYSLSGLANYSLTGDLLHGLSVVGGISYTRLLNDFADSPIVSVRGDRDQWFGAVGLAYTF